MRWSLSHVPLHAPSGPLATAGRGRPLGQTERAELEPRFGKDLGDVRIHTGPEATSSARALDARAYTTGQNIVFGDGEYAPSTPEGKRLLAHELTHAVQQSSSPGASARQRSSGLAVSSPGDHTEIEADRVADAVMAGRSAGAVGAAQPAIARAPAHPSSGFKTGDIGGWSYIAYLDQKPAKMRLRWYDSNKPEKDPTHEIGQTTWVANNPGNIRTIPGDPNEQFAANTLNAYEKRPGPAKSPASPVTDETRYRTFEVFASEAEGSAAIVPFLQQLARANPSSTVEGILKIYRAGAVKGGGNPDQLEYVKKVRDFITSASSAANAGAILAKLGTAATTADLNQVRPAIEFLEGGKKTVTTPAPTAAPGPSASAPGADAGAPAPAPATPAAAPTTTVMTPPPGVEYVCGSGFTTIDRARYSSGQLTLIDALTSAHEAEIKAVLGCP